jgi:hypothetical protein
METRETTPDPWAVLEQVRLALEGDGPHGSDFVQTFLPAGFQQGDRETGTLWIDLPRCVRWDYEIPFPKSFLLCGDTAHHWVPGDPQGRVYQVSAAQEPGLDLLLLEVEDLSHRYRAEPLLEGTRQGLRLEILEPQTSGPVRAEIWLSPSRARLESLVYWDTEGNRTRFDLSGYRPLPDDRKDGGSSMFTPPEGMAWVYE